MRCPVCNSNRFVCELYKEDCWGSIIIVEQHGYCPQCGYVIEQAYSPIMEAFCDIKKGHKARNGTYIKKNIRKHKRYRRKSKIRLEINPEWIKHI